MNVRAAHWFTPAILVVLYSVPAAPQSLPSGDEVTFKAETNLVLVPVVVRDAAGDAVGGLRKEDFQLFDNGKAQPIASFTVEETSGQVAEDRNLAGNAPLRGSTAGSAAPAQAAPMVVPDHFVALLLDDQHFKIGNPDPPPGYVGDVGDLWYARDAALKLLNTLQPADRVAIFTTSGDLTLDFTADRAKLREALSKLRPGKPVLPTVAGSGLAAREIENQTRDAVMRSQDVVRRMSFLPGRRTMVYISPGLLLYGSELPETMQLIDSAIRSRVVINSLDARGLAINRNGIFQEFQARVTDGTGGTYIRDTNDIDGAVRRLAATPKYIYVLGFPPDSVKADGSFHKLTVKLPNGHKLDLQARKGYYAPGGRQAAQKAKQAAAADTAEVPRLSAAETSEVARALGIATTAAPSAVAPRNDEIVTRDEPAVFKVQTNLVEVPVIARDRAGHAVGNLRQENFRVYDKGKRQEITKFSVQQSAAAAGAAEHPRAALPGPAQAAAPPNPAGRFIAFVFDDLHLRFADLPQVREAVRRYLRSSVQPDDRIAVLTTSGKIRVDLTAKAADLDAALEKIVPNPLTPSALRACLYISYSQAVQIAQQVSLHPFLDDLPRSVALKTANFDAAQCLPGMDARSVFDTTVEEVRQAYYNGEQETRAVMGALRSLVRRLAVLPGQRTVILVSPGFFVSPELQNLGSDLVAQAIRYKVLINTIDARGVWTDPSFDASRTGGPPPADVVTFRQMDAGVAADELIALAQDTGGTVHQNNDFNGAVRQSAAAPEYLYVLGFAPQDLKLDGSFHTLKVTVNSPEKVTLQVRRGYWAARQAEDEVAVAGKEIENAVFSRDEIHSLPVDMHTQVTAAGGQATLGVLTSVDLKQIHLRKVDDRNRNDLTIVAALFDTNGNFIAGTRKVMQLRLRDETVRGLEQKPPTVIAMDFGVKAGAYLVRLVVRDTESGQMTAENAAVRVP